MTTDHLAQLLADEERDDRVLGRRLRTARERACLTIDELATLTGIPSDCLHDHESGQSPLSLTRIRLIASALDTDTLTLLTRLLFPLG